MFQVQHTNENRTGLETHVVVIVLLSATTVCGKACLEGCDCVGEQYIVADCSGKKLNKVPENVNTTLHYIDLSNNSITEIRLHDLRGYASIRILHLSNNGVSNIYEDSFKELVNVTHIYLSENNISYFPPTAFNNNVNLKKLYLKGNPLTLPEHKSILESDSITYLDIAFCDITVLPADIFVALPKLVALRLDGNILTNITIETFEPLRNLEEIYMESKTLKCAESSYQEFFKYLEKRGIKYYGPPICCEECLTTIPLTLKLTVPIATPTVYNQTKVVTSVIASTISATETTTPSLKRTTFTSNEARHTANTSSLVTHNPVLQDLSNQTEGHEELTSKSVAGNYSPSLMMTTINLLSIYFGLLCVL
jgi:hypothetical protein